jgi:hypothetical protein
MAMSAGHVRLDQMKVMSAIERPGRRNSPFPSIVFGPVDKPP